MIIIISFRRCSQRTRPKRVCGYERYLDYLHRHEIPESSRADEVPFMHDGGTIVIAQRAP
jgi:hypothetical protein